MSGNAFCPFHIWKHSGLLGEGGGGGGGKKQFLFFFPAGQWVSLSLLSCPTAAIINKLSLCREEVAETEGLKPTSGQWLPRSSLALAKGQGTWWPGPAQRGSGCPRQNNWPGNTVPSSNCGYPVQGSFLPKLIPSKAF